MSSSKIKKKQNTVILIVGPTAVGKTALSVKLAHRLQCDILSCDSRQFYKEMSIGTAKPTLEEMQDIKHHFVDSHSINQYYSAGDFERDVHEFLIEYFKNNDVLIITGGSGLFVNAITIGLDDMPPAPLAIREALMQTLKTDGLLNLQAQLLQIDPELYHKIDIKNSQRVVRALEVYNSTGIKMSELQKKQTKVNDFNIIKIGVELPRPELYDRINTRVDHMLAAGLVSEVQSLMEFKEHNALKTVGYKEVFSFLDHELTHSTMVELIKRNTRRYAKRQLTWFKNQDTFEWFLPTDTDAIQRYISENLA